MNIRKRRFVLSNFFALDRRQVRANYALDSRKRLFDVARPVLFPTLIVLNEQGEVPCRIERDPFLADKKVEKRAQQRFSLELTAVVREDVCPSQKPALARDEADRRADMVRQPASAQESLTPRDDEVLVDRACRQ